jgi:hypothetical protein
MKLQYAAYFLLMTSVTAFRRNIGDEGDQNRHLFARQPPETPNHHGGRDLGSSWHNSGSGTMNSPTSSGGSGAAIGMCTLNMNICYCRSCWSDHFLVSQDHPRQLSSAVTKVRISHVFVEIRCALQSGFTHNLGHIVFSCKL